MAPFSFEGSPLQEDQYTQVTCFAVEGDLPITFNCLLNNNEIHHYTEISTSKIGKRSSMLTIESVSYRNSGNYSCSAKNEAGEASYTTQLLVNS